MVRFARPVVLLLWTLALVLAPAVNSSAQPRPLGPATPAPSGTAAAAGLNATAPVIERYQVPIAGSPTDGPATAKVTVVVFSDFQCPFCQRHAATMSELRARFGSALRLVFKNEPLPFHPRAEPAAQFALEAFKRLGHRGFWRAHDGLFADRKALGEDEMAQLAASLGLDPRRTMKAVADHAHLRLIEADTDLAEDVGARGTPTTFVNGRRLSGARNLEEFAEVVDAEIAIADGLLARGVPATRIYDELQKNALTAGVPTKVRAPAVTAAQPSRGPRNAPVTIQLFSDFQCPFCARAQEAIGRVEQEFGPKVRLVWRHMPLPMHDNARDASTAAAEAFAQKGSAGFWAMHDRLFADQQSLHRVGLRATARELGLDLKRFDVAIATDRYARAIDTDIRLAEAAGIKGTPTLMVNGYLIEGAPTYGKLSRTVRRALKDAGLR